MRQVRRSTMLRYGVAVLSVALAVILTLPLGALASRMPFAFFFAAVMLSAWYGGLGPGLLSTALSALASAYFFLTPEGSLNPGLTEIIQLGVFLMVAIFINSLTAARTRAEEASRESEQWLLTTLQSIGDAVIATDAQGRVAFMNAVAQALTGWKQEEAKGQELKEVFHIINEASRREVESPVARVFRESSVVGLANHTLLITKDGNEVPIDDSGAPIRDEGGNITGVVLVFRDITERKQAETARLRLAAIVESSDDAIIGKTLEGVITSWNAGAERIYGYGAEEAVGRPISFLVPSDRSDDVPHILKIVRQGEGVKNRETVRARKDGTKIYISLTVSPIKDDEGNIIGASTIAHDITERKRAEEERAHLLARAEEARAHAEEANRTKDEFLATLSHELRTPLTAMLGWTRMLRTRQLDETTSAHALQTIERNVKAQAQLIEDLLDVSGIITGKLRLDVSPVELMPVVEAALDSVRPAADAKSIRLQTMLDPLTGPVSGDPARLQQVVWNLVSNAVKFTPRDRRIDVRLGRVESHVEITVTDTGAGINPEFLPHVFERFRQADSSTTRQHGGLGLGLAIVRHLVELHGGTVHAESPGQGLGSTFKVKLPVMVTSPVKKLDAELKPGELGVSSPLAGPPTLDHLHVLVVDDERDARELLVTVLEKCGASTMTVATAAEAIDALTEHRPDILISDIGMPGEDGYELIRRVRLLPEHQGGSIPAVALTAYAGEENRRQALAAGFQMHLSKPVDPEELALAISTLVGPVEPE